MPDWREYVARHLHGLRLSPAREHEVIAELALQLEQAYQAALAGGGSEEEALRRAELQVPDWDKLAHEINATAVPERVRRFSGVGGDLRYALRFFRRSPAFTAIAVCTLAFGIGGNTAIFTLVDALALRPLPYRQPDRLMTIDTRKAQQPEIEPWTSAPDLFDMRDRCTSFSAVAGISPIWNLILTGHGPAERMNALYVSADFFPLLGAGTALGRTFDPREDRRATPSNVVVMSHAFWEKHFGGSGDAIGRTLELSGSNYTVIGVMPVDFRYAGEPVAGAAVDIDLWLPLSDNQLAGSGRGLRFLKAIGRLKPGISVEQANDEVRRFSAALAEQYPATNRGFATGAEPLKTQVRGRFRVAGLLLLSTVGFVLLMACANVANLLLARAAARGREISVRIALGASRWRLLRQLLTEGLVLAFAGGAAGLGIAYFAVAMLVRTGPEALMLTHPVHLDGRALIATMTAVVLSAILAGLPPALRMLSGDVQRGLREAGRSLTAGAHAIRSALVVLQVSVALVLLVGAGLLVRSFSLLLEVDPGFNPRNVVTITTLLPTAAQTPEQRDALYRRIQEQLRAVPGVDEVAAVSRLPLMGRNLGTWVYREGRIEPGRPGMDVEYRVATPNYFRTMGIPLRAGRLFDEHDDSHSSAILINQTAARRIWPGEDPIGKRVKTGADPERAAWLTVVGVVGDVRHVGIDVDPLPEMYRPYAINPLSGPILVIRTGRDPEPMLAELGAKVRAVSSQMPAYNMWPMQTLVDRSTAQRRFLMLLLSGFSALALLLAAVGVYGTVSQAVAQRTAEIGLRMALGASPGAAMRLVLGLGWRLIAAGMAIGTLAAVGLTQLMRRLLFEVRPLDPAAFGAAVLVLAAFAFVACYVPARRATRVDPLDALRRDG